MAISIPPKVFLDSNVLFSALYSPAGAPGKILQLYGAGRLSTVVSELVIREMARAISDKAPQLSAAVAALLSDRPPEIVPDPPRTAVLKYLPHVNSKDAPIVAAAIGAGVDYFVTGDRRIADEIRSLNPPFRVLTPSELVGEITND